MKIVVGVVCPGTPGSLTPDYSSGNIQGIVFKNKLQLCCHSVPLVHGEWPKPNNQRCLRDDAILCRISSPHTCHGSSDNINGSKLGSRSMVTAEAIFCVKLRKKLASHEWASAGALFHIVVEVTRTDMCHNVIMPGHLCQCVRLWPERGISWKIPAHGHWRPGDWTLHEISWPGVCTLSWHQCDMCDNWSLCFTEQTEERGEGCQSGPFWCRHDDCF